VHFAIPDFTEKYTFGCFEEESSPTQNVLFSNEGFSTLILLLGYDILTLAKGTCVCIVEI